MKPEKEKGQKRREEGTKAEGEVQWDEGEEDVEGEVQLDEGEEDVEEEVQLDQAPKAGPKGEIKEREGKRTERKTAVKAEEEAEMEMAARKRRKEKVKKKGGNCGEEKDEEQGEEEGRGEVASGHVYPASHTASREVKREDTDPTGFVTGKEEGNAS